MNAPRRVTYITPEGATSLEEFEHGRGLCMRCGARTVEFYDEHGRTVGPLAPLPPIGVRCRSCDMHHEGPPATA